MSGARPRSFMALLGLATLAGMSFAAADADDPVRERKPRPLGPPPRLRETLDPATVDAALRGDAPRPFRDERLRPQTPIPEELAAQAKRERKAEKAARDAERREAGRKRPPPDPIVEPHRVGFPTTITVEGRSS